MKNKNADGLAIARRIRDAGRPIYIAEDDAKERYLPADGLIVRQTGGVEESRAIEYLSGTSFIISLAITCKLPKFAIGSFGLEPPWPLDFFHWLEDPLQIDGKSRSYRVPCDDGVDFERHRVLNHQADLTRILSPGHSLVGVLLGYSFNPIPEDFRTGTLFPTFVIIYDQFGAMHRTGVDLQVVRRPKRASSRRKRSLLDHRDHIVRGHCGR